MQLANYTLHNHCLFSLFATKVTTQWLKQLTCFCSVYIQDLLKEGDVVYMSMKEGYVVYMSMKEGYVVYMSMSLCTCD